MSVIAAMGEDGLKKFVPKLGDRVAIVRFCKNGGCFSTDNRQRLSLVERIRLYQNQSENGNTSASLTKPKSRQKSSGDTYLPNEKPTRVIKIGWMLNGKTVRERNGGGVRTISMSKMAKKQDILQKGLELFFPNGFSDKHGSLSKYSCNLLDYKENIFDENFTVGNMYKVTNLPMLRFYVSTNINEDEKDVSTEKPLVEISTTTSTHTSTAAACDVPVATIQSYDELFSDQELFDIDNVAFSENISSPFVGKYYIILPICDYII